MGLWSSFVRAVGPVEMVLLDQPCEEEDGPMDPVEEDTLTFTAARIVDAHKLLSKIDQLKANRDRLSAISDERLEVCERLSVDRYYHSGSSHHAICTGITPFHLRIAMMADINDAITTAQNDLRQLGVKVDG